MAENTAAKGAETAKKVEDAAPAKATDLTREDVRTGQGLTGGRKVENVRDENGNVTGVKVTYYNRPDLATAGAENITVTS